jgi:hypothetical protein
VIKIDSLGSVFTKVFHGILPDQEIVRRAHREGGSLHTFPIKRWEWKIANIFQGSNICFFLASNSFLGSIEEGALDELQGFSGRHGRGDV